jgi:hypothetical protein
VVRFTCSAFSSLFVGFEVAAVDHLAVVGGLGVHQGQLAQQGGAAEPQSTTSTSTSLVSTGAEAVLAPSPLEAVTWPAESLRGVAVSGAARKGLPVRSLGG